MGKLRSIFKRFSLLILLALSAFNSSSQVFDQKVADYILKVEHPLFFLQRIEKIGVKDQYVANGKAGLDSAYLWLKKISEQAGYVTHIQNFLVGADTLHNIEFIKKGSSDSCIVIGAHYDSKNGAGVNDNGTGDFAIYQIAKLIKNVETKYTIRFVYFSAEEISYNGSEHYVSTLNKDSVKIKFMLNIDQLGGTTGEDNSGVKCEMDDVSGNMDKSNVLAKSMAKIYSLYTNLNPVISSAYQSDYLAFRQAGYVISGVYQFSNFPYIHSQNDLLKYIEFTSLVSTVKGALAFVLYQSGAEVPAGIESKKGHTQNINVYCTNKSLVINSDSDYSLLIYDGLGREIISKQGSEKDKTISLNQLKTGIYYALLKTERGMTYNKFLVEP